ncbi:DUF1365 domain-containing protein [Photobacterium aphoticum]|nr:DUF1365 family protein [Photobacterium aphoticum]PSU60200.1 DUF1365 domain-containing protein [Photobacterium aphoticum]
MNSALYVGTVRHRRFAPMTHEFNYPMFMPFIDLDELDQLERNVFGFGRYWYQFARVKLTDYLRAPSEPVESDQHDHRKSDRSKSDRMRDAQALKQAIIDKAEALTGERVEGRVMMLSQIRYAGVYFSPINLFYLYDEQGVWKSVLVEVSNTPWNERHYYALPATDDWQTAQWREEKQFHVSPFNPMSQYYQWQLKEPLKQLLVHLDIHDQADDRKVLDATMAMKRQPFTTGVLWRLLAKTPIQTLKVVIGIYWQALKLWLKKAPFYDHPVS